MLYRAFALLVTSVIAVSAFSIQPAVSDEVIYGEDNRREYYQATSEATKILARSTVALFSASAVMPDVNRGVANLATRSYSQVYNLCQDEPFSEQINGAFCSGSLVAPNLVMTAGHCVESVAECKDTRFVFDFAITSPGSVGPNSVPLTSVYSCANLVASVVDDRTGSDYALVQLDRPVTDRIALKIRRSGRVNPGEPIFVVGHPAGLPTKIADGARVRRHRGAYFISNLDTYGGNSGSAVFNQNTGEIEGILVRGEQDYTWDGNRGCRVSNRCPDGGCRGEDVTSVQELANLIPEHKLIPPSRPYLPNLEVWNPPVYPGRIRMPVKMPAPIRY